MTRVGDKWSVLVVVTLGSGPKRFNELKRLVAGITQRMLTVTLRSLERDGLVSRKVYPTVPPSVEYRLTGLGKTLLKPVTALASWAIQHKQAIDQAREEFDARVKG